MKIKNVVKVMNFQALLRMDKALKEADKYRDVGKEITDILSRIMYNKNLILDKKILEPDKNKPKLNIYIANDYGFCGNFNSSISRQVRKDKESYKIIIGKKINYSDDLVVLKIDKEDFFKRFLEIERIIDPSRELFTQVYVEGNFSSLVDRLTELTGDENLANKLAREIVETIETTHKNMRNAIENKQFFMKNYYAQQAEAFVDYLKQQLNNNANQVNTNNSQNINENTSNNTQNSNESINQESNKD